MGNHQHDPNAVALWNHFSSVINWVKAVFPNYRKEMKGVDWGTFYAKYHEGNWDAAALEADHITPWCDGGRTVAENCQMLCRECNRRKSGK